MAIFLEAKGDSSARTCLKPWTALGLGLFLLCILAQTITRKDLAQISPAIRRYQIGHGLVVEGGISTQNISSRISWRPNKGSIRRDDHELFNPRMGDDCCENVGEDQPPRDGHTEDAQRLHDILAPSKDLEVVTESRAPTSGVASKPASLFLAFYSV
jgi:hypothetical protein